MIWTQKELARVCEEWKRELFLSHWQTTIKFKRREVLEDREGRVYVTKTRLEASIEILDERDRCENPDFPYDTERTIVHELLHIAMDDLSEEVASDREEQIVHNLSRTLTNLKRYHKENELEGG